ncbi:MAG TPA: hypothetical protein VIN11_00615 [Roseivirga sp.]
MEMSKYEDKNISFNQQKAQILPPTKALNLSYPWMNLRVKTQVSQCPQKVLKGFNQNLFKQLSPPFPKVRIINFGGSKRGDLVELELNFALFKQRWTSKITEDFESEDELYFVDEGILLPFPLKRWRHKHLIKRNGNGSEIIDDIQFSGPNKIMDVLIYPFLALQFIYRKPIYRKIFGHN